jgi:hypothetical protein
LIQIPDVPAQLSQKVRIRYLCDNAIAGGLLPATDLLSAVLVAYSTTAAMRIFLAVRLIGVHTYFVGDFNSTSADDNFAFLSLEWLGGDNSDSKAKISIAAAAVPGHRYYKVPKKDTFASMWYRHDASNATNSLFKLTAPIGTYVDLVFEVVFRGHDNPTQSSGYTIVGGTTGNVCYPKLMEGDLVAQGVSVVALA